MSLIGAASRGQLRWAANGGARRAAAARAGHRRSCHFSELSTLYTEHEDRQAMSKDKTSNPTAETTPKTGGSLFKCYERAAAAGKTFAAPVMVSPDAKPTDTIFQAVLEWHTRGHRVQRDFAGEEEIPKMTKAAEDAFEDEERVAEAVRLMDEVRALKKSTLAKRDECMKLGNAHGQATAQLTICKKNHDFAAAATWRSIVKAADTVGELYFQQLKEAKTKSAPSNGKKKRKGSSKTPSGKKKRKAQQETTEANLLSSDIPLSPLTRSKHSRPRKAGKKKRAAKKKAVGKKDSPQSKKPTKKDDEISHESWLKWVAEFPVAHHGLRYYAEAKAIFCQACGVRVTRHNKKHLLTKKHRDNVVDMHENNLAQMRMGDKGGKTKPVTHVFREGFLGATYQAGIPIRSLQILIDYLQPYLRMDYTIGNATDLARDYTPDLLDNHKAKLQQLLGNCFPAYSIVVDGTPSYDKAEAISLRAVHIATMDIVSPLISVNLFPKSLTGNQTARNVLQAVKTMGLSISNCRAAMMDRAATNQKAIRVIGDEEILGNEASQITFKSCDSHNLCKPGDVPVAEEATALQRVWNTAIQHPGAASSMFKELCREEVKRAQGIRWWVTFSQVRQLHEHLDAIDEHMIDECVRRKWSAKSFENMRSMMSTLSDKLKIKVQLAALITAGLPFYEATYLLESDQPMVLSAYIVFEKLDEFVRDVVEEAGSPLRHACRDAARQVHSKLRTVRERVANLDSEIARATTEKSKLAETAQTAAPRQRNRIDYRQLNNSGTTESTRGSNRVGQDCDGVEGELAGLEKRLSQLVSSREEALKDAEEESDKFPAKSESDFREIAMDVIRPICEKYQSLYAAVLVGTNHRNAHVAEMKKGLLACKVFDPYAMLHSDVPMLSARLADLKNLGAGFPEFDDDEFLRHLRDEYPQVVAFTRQHFSDKWLPFPEWKHKSTPADPRRANHVGIRDPIKRAELGYAWWQHVFCHNPSMFPTFKKALLLAVLVQTSSAFVERVFSQLNSIVRLCGSQMLNETLEARCMLKVNSQLPLTAVPPEVLQARKAERERDQSEEVDDGVESDESDGEAELQQSEAEENEVETDAESEESDSE